MDRQVTVAVGFPVRDEVLEAIGRVDPRVRVVHLPGIARPGAPGAGADEWKQQLAGADVLFGPTSIPREFIEAAPNLRWFQVINAGVDRLAQEGLLDRGFVVTNVSGLVAVSIAEWVMGTALMLAKNLHQAVRAQGERRWSAWRVGELAGQTMGIAGLGAIGRETARRARAFDMRVIASRRTAAPGAADPDCDEVVGYDDLARLLRESDYLVLCVPLTAETHHLIGARELAMMKPTATLVNIARGAVVDQEALIAALRQGTIAAAALDVFDPEPLPAESPLWGMENVIMTPHISGSIEGYGRRSAELFVENLGRFVSGEKLMNVVDPGLGY
ncbi:MAG: D-2-hydroxyacid dehydrogenase [Thermoflexaceae bacterium]|nr:D-2-hydroxyacid dehydrogenase [Thermoflexaceae bacterium]